MGTGTETRYAYEPEIVYPPGEKLVEWLEEHGMAADDVADASGLSRDGVDQLLTGSASVTDTVARALERATAVPADVWLRIEAMYRAAGGDTGR